MEPQEKNVHAHTRAHTCSLFKVGMLHLLFHLFHITGTITVFTSDQEAPG